MVPKPPADTPPPELPSVAGNMQHSISEHERACRILIADEQLKLSPDNHLIATLCDSVRMGREYVDYTRHRAIQPPADTPTLREAAEFAFAVFSGKTMANMTKSEKVACRRLKFALEAPADTREPTPLQMLEGASELEALAQGIRDAVAGRVKPLEDILADMREPPNEVTHKDSACVACGCSQTLPVNLQLCRCTCHPRDREPNVPHWRFDPKAIAAFDYLQEIGVNGDEAREYLINLNIRESGE